MPIIHHQTIIAAPIGQVWVFFTDPVKNLPRISPPSDAVVIESADLPIKEGSKLVIIGRDPLGRRLRWESQIQQFTPPHSVVFGTEARFVDIQLAGPFRHWKHEHEFEAVDSKTTRMVDRLTYTPPAGLLGMLADWFYLRWRLRSLLKYRGKALREALEQ